MQICSILHFLLVDFGKVLCSSENELQQNSNAFSREDSNHLVILLSRSSKRILISISAD